MLLADFFYNGVARWQLGFDNPNKAAVLAVELILVGLALVAATRRLVLRVLGAVLTVGSLYVLLHTFSRGGMVALAVAAVPLAIGFLRYLKGTRTFVRVCFLVIAVAFCLLSVRMGDVGRLVYGVSGEDRSVGNRIELWRSVPRMLRDAPFGWGIGKSGEVYRQWYQPLDRDERYRTLVNSHLTWIVETGIIGGVVWSLGWGIVLAFGFLVGRYRGGWLCWSEWTALFGTALFSSVCESWTLWVIPVAVLGRTLVKEGRMFKHALVGGVWLTVCLGCVAGVSLGFLVGDGETLIGKRGYGILVGRSRPLFWLVPDSSVLGGETYPREIRDALRGQENASLAIVLNARQVPADAEVVVICGGADDAGRRGRQKTIWLSPKRTDIQPGEGQMVVVGALSSVSEAYGSGTGVVRIEGAGDYIPNWPNLLMDLSMMVFGGR